MSDILTPLFEVASKLAMIEELPFHFSVGTYINQLGNRIHVIAWWISEDTFAVDDGLARSDSVIDIDVHSMFTDDINEDDLDEWITELTEVLDNG